jgi:hypothetical protein
VGGFDAGSFDGDVGGFDTGGIVPPVVGRTHGGRLRTRNAYTPEPEHTREIEPDWSAIEAQLQAGMVGAISRALIGEPPVSAEDAPIMALVPRAAQLAQVELERLRELAQRRPIIDTAAQRTDRIERIIADELYRRRYWAAFTALILAS